MIYRALECGVYGSSDPSTELWLSASNDQDAHDRAMQLLSLLWQVAPSDICLNGMPKSETALSAAYSNSDGDRSWFQSGSHGRYPTYYVSEKPHVVVFLSARERRRFDAALAEAVVHAQSIAQQMRSEDAEAYAITIEGLERFAARYQAAAH